MPSRHTSTGRVLALGGGIPLLPTNWWDALADGSFDAPVGELVGSWTDRVGGVAATEATIKPTRVANGVTFSSAGGGSRLNISWSPTGWTAMTGFVILSMTSATTTSTGAPWSFGTSPDSNAYYYFIGGGPNYENFGSTIRKGPTSPIPVTVTNPHIYSARSRNGAWNCAINKTQLLSTASNTFAVDTSPLIGRSKGTAPGTLNCTIRGVMIFASYLDDSVYNALADWAAAYYGVSL